MASQEIRRQLFSLIGQFSWWTESSRRYHDDCSYFYNIELSDNVKRIIKICDSNVDCILRHPVFSTDCIKASAKNADIGVSIRDIFCLPKDDIKFIVKSSSTFSVIHAADDIENRAKFEGEIYEIRTNWKANVELFSNQFASR